jgi:hypothetical protein
MPDPITASVALRASSAQFDASLLHFAVDAPDRRRFGDLITSHTGILDVIHLNQAADAINAKAAQLGGLPGNPQADVTDAGAGYVRRYDGCDIYFSTDTGAHEVHGDIRAKYNALGGPGALGLPTTDESGTPDGIGRFNHFSASASIYWTPGTGPMMVQGPIRDLWAGRGWETGPLGYPIADAHRLRSNSPATDPVVAWSLFQNGAIVNTPDGTDVARTAGLTPDRLRSFIRTEFDKAFHEHPVDIGLQPNVETIEVSNWGYGFWAGQPRMITFRLHGFHDNGLLPDTDFDMDVRLRFRFTWQPGFTEPGFKTLVVELDSVSVTANGIAPGEVASGVANGVKDAFQQPRTIVDIPTGATVTPPINIDVIDVLVTADGGLQVLLNPLPPLIGGFRQVIAQQRIDALAG